MCSYVYCTFVIIFQPECSFMPFLKRIRGRGVARGGSQGFRSLPSLSRQGTPPLLISVMESRFLKFFVLFYAYNKYSERHCGIYLRFTYIFRDMSRVGILHSLSRPVSQFDYCSLL